MSKQGTFAEEIKKQLLSLSIKPECCKSSFISGTEIFARSRKNSVSDALEAYIEALKTKKRRSFFDENVMKGYAVSEKGGIKYPSPTSMVCENCFSHLLRGAFIVAGRASKADGNLHLETVMPNSVCTEIISELLSDIGLGAKHTVRKGEELLYYKKAERVEDFLAYIGAVNASFEITNASILKGLRSSANRQKNCDTTNVMRSLAAATLQIEAINAIIKNENGLDGLSDGLRITAKIRLENPIESLDGITDLHTDKITKSGVNHRLAKIVSYAEKKGYIK